MVEPEWQKLQSLEEVSCYDPSESFYRWKLSSQHRRKDFKRASPEQEPFDLLKDLVTMNKQFLAPTLAVL